MTRPVAYLALVASLMSMAIAYDNRLWALLGLHSVLAVLCGTVLTIRRWW